MYESLLGTCLPPSLSLILRIRAIGALLLSRSPPLSTLLRRPRYGYLARLLPSFRGSCAPLHKPALDLHYFALLKLCLLAVTLVFALMLLPLAQALAASGASL